MAMKGFSTFTRSPELDSLSVLPRIPLLWGRSHSSANDPIYSKPPTKRHMEGRGEILSFKKERVKE